jgi:hypothetical protein
MRRLILSRPVRAARRDHHQHGRGYFSQLKRSIDGTHHHVSKTHLDRYLAQFDFLYSLCKASDSVRMCALIRQAGGAGSATSH